MYRYGPGGDRAVCLKVLTEGGWTTGITEGRVAGAYMGFVQPVCHFEIDNLGAGSASARGDLVDELGQVGLRLEETIGFAW